MTERVVLCMKWGTVFPPSHVNMLYRAVSDHMVSPFRFVCLTDEDEGLMDGIEVHPIPDLGLESERFSHGAWPKLSVYSRDLHGLTGRCLFVDLDSVIVGGLDPFFEVEGRYIGQDGGPDWRRGRRQVNPRLNTTTFAFNFGDQAQILDRFMADKEAAFSAYQNDQDYAEALAEDRKWWPENWIVSFKRHLRQPIGLDLFTPPRAPGPEAKIIAFHGDPRPGDVAGRKGLWSDPPHFVKCPIDWLDSYFAKYGD